MHADWRRAGNRAVTVVVAAAFLVALLHVLGLRPIGSADAHQGHWHWDVSGKGLPEPVVPADNPMSSEKVALGRRLFYERRLSGNGTTSCGSCHMQSKAFTDGRTRAVGATGQLTDRSSPTLTNVAYNRTFAWANPSLRSLEQQILVPLFGEHPVEMGVTDTNSQEILERLRGDDHYTRMFKDAFPGTADPVTWGNVTMAITTFQRTLISGDSKYDRALRGEATLTESEERGMNLFFGERAECHHCHNGINMSDQQTYVGAFEEPIRFHNTGLYDIDGRGGFPEPNTGVHEVTGKAGDMGMFRAPTLRNIATTAPYMHDGSLATLRDVVDFYADGGRNITTGPNQGDGRKNPFKSGLIVGNDLSDAERDDLVAFLTTLTDDAFLSNPAFSDPFTDSNRTRNLVIGGSIVSVLMIGGLSVLHRRRRRSR